MEQASGSKHPDPVLDRFLDELWAVDGLAKLTLDAYRRDLKALSGWLADRGSALTEASRADLLAFLGTRMQAGSRPKSVARWLSSQRRFYRFLVAAGLRRDDPTTRIDAPSIG
ncbi:MAG: site-specific integrase, partial [Thioalkalivibrio sp.]|nr:site-specific integrase [Thioalkalivibrio sp.]